MDIFHKLGKMRVSVGFTILVALTGVCAQLTYLNVLTCGNLDSGLCRLQCQSGELSVYPYTCSLYTAVYGVNYQRCVTSMPCCYFAGSCQTSCNASETQLSSAATCNLGGAVCCVPTSLVGPVTPTSATATTTSPAASSVSARQGVCGSAVTARASYRSPFERPTSRIIGGSVARATDWPWLVRITFTGSTGFCAGVLVDSDTVVTAAHCLAGVDRSIVQVILADYDLSTVDADEEVVDVASYYILSGFIRGQRNGDDFAVVKLARNITYTDRKLPACLPDPSIPLVSPSDCYIAGWGVSEQGLGGPLRAANVRLLDRTTCGQRLSEVARGTVNIPDTMVCTDNPASAPTDGCLFDDGDMLVCRDTQGRWSLVGVMSEYSCGSALPILFTDVRNYTDVTLDRL